MKKLSYIMVSALLTLMSATSCSDFLEAENKSAGGDANDPEVYFRTSTGIQAFRAYAYQPLKTIVTALDIADDGTDLYETCRGTAPSSFQNYTLTADDQDVENFYVACFGLVNNANGMMYYSGTEFPQYYAEGQFLRALGYYYLTQHFGAVPYSDTYIQNSNRDYPRADLETIYTNCENDLIEVIGNSAVPEESHDGSVNKRAARALLAKMYLAHGWDCNTTLVNAETGEYTVNSTENFEKAAQMAEQAISGISLTQPFEDKWSPYNEDTNPETFFAVQYDKAGWPGDLADGGHRLCEYYCHYYGAMSDGVKYTTSQKNMTTHALALWEKGDERWAGTFMTTIYEYDSNVGDWFKAGYFSYYNNDVDKNSAPIFTYYAPTYVTQEEFEAYLRAHQSQFAMTGVNRPEPHVPHANLLQNGSVLRYNFNADGSIAAGSPVVISGFMSTLNQSSSLDIAEGTPPVKKYDDPTTAIGGDHTYSFRDIVVLHASEIYLTAAEAYYMAGNEPAAWEKINAVRNRAKAPNLNNSLANYGVEVKFSNFDLLDLILDERARECYAEQTRYIDLRRTKQLVRYNIAYNHYTPNVSSMQGASGEIKWYRPIPETEISSNDGISSEDQNPGY